MRPANGFFAVGHKEFGSLLITDCSGAVNNNKKRSQYAAQAGLELLILLPQPHDCWDYRYVSQYPTGILIQGRINTCLSGMLDSFQLIHESDFSFLHRKTSCWNAFIKLKCQNLEAWGGEESEQRFAGQCSL
jgi:hypothetical protein